MYKSWLVGLAAFPNSEWHLLILWWQNGVQTPTYNMRARPLTNSSPLLSKTCHGSSFPSSVFLSQKSTSLSVCVTSMQLNVQLPSPHTYVHMLLWILHCVYIIVCTYYAYALAVACINSLETNVSRNLPCRWPGRHLLILLSAISTAALYFSHSSVECTYAYILCTHAGQCLECIH